MTLTPLAIISISLLNQQEKNKKEKFLIPLVSTTV
jgi:hypothetical protein